MALKAHSHLIVAHGVEQTITAWKCEQYQYEMAFPGQFTVVEEPPFCGCQHEDVVT